MRKIAVLTDSSADIHSIEADKLGIHVIRMPLIIDDVQHLEETDIDLATFIDKMNNGSAVKTSSPIIGNLLMKWDELLENHDEVVYLPISSGLSGSYGTAYAASKNYDGKVIVIDTKFVCYPLTLLCQEILKMANKGYNGEQIKSLVEENAELWACLMPYNLNALMRGGRIAPAVATLGNLLKIVPLLKVENGAIDVQDKVRTHRKAYEKAVQICTSVDNPNDYDFIVVEADCKEEAKNMASRMEQILGVPVPIYPMQAVIISHTGPNTVACARIKKLVY